MATKLTTRFFFSTSFSLGMLPRDYLADAVRPEWRRLIEEVSPERAADWLRHRMDCGDLVNVANPNHANTLAAVSQLLGVDVATGATGGRVTLERDDILLVAQLDAFALPRETREFTDEEIAMAGIRFFIVSV